MFVVFRAFVSSLICLLVGYVGIRCIALLTTKIKEFESLKGNSLAAILFAGGFFIYVGFVVYVSMVNPFFLLQSVTLGAYFKLQSLLVVEISTIFQLLL